MIKVDIFSGFLGAGKTTLIKKLINEAYSGEKLVLIENEFGEIGIDGGFLKDAGIEITEMNSGCICCSLVGDFSEALSKVAKEYSPDRILIEPSGVGKLSDVIRAVENAHCDELHINSAVTVCDAKKCKMYSKNFGEFYNDQIKNASVVILSHTGNLSEEKIGNAVNIVKEINENAILVTTDWDKLSGEQIKNAIEKSDSLEHEIHHLMEENEVCPECGHHHHHAHEHEHHHHDHDEHCCCGHEHHEHHHEHEHGEHCSCGHDHHEHHHHHADDVFTSWGCETTKKFSADIIKEALDKLIDEKTYGTILRAKGIVEGEYGEWIHFDYIPGEADVRVGLAGITGRICVIGSDINEAEIRNLFDL